MAVNLPFWLSPKQIIIANITDKHVEFALEIEKSIKDSGFRCSLDLRNEKIGYKIREHIIAKDSICCNNW
jgi:threonyl-tRNA synthetase